MCKPDWRDREETVRRGGGDKAILRLCCKALSTNKVQIGLESNEDTDPICLERGLLHMLENPGVSTESVVQTLNPRSVIRIKRIIVKLIY